MLDFHKIPELGFASTDNLPCSKAVTVPCVNLDISGLFGSGVILYWSRSCWMMCVHILRTRLCAQPCFAMWLGARCQQPPLLRPPAHGCSSSCLGALPKVLPVPDRWRHLEPKWEKKVYSYIFIKNARPDLQLTQTAKCPGPLQGMVRTGWLWTLARATQRCSVRG